MYTTTESTFYPFGITHSAAQMSPIALESAMQHVWRNYTLKKMFGWTNQNFVDSTVEYGYYTDNQIFGWANKIFWLIKFGWLY